MSSVPPVQAPSTVRKYFAMGLGIVTLLCALLYWLVYAFVVAQVYAGVYGGPELLMAVMVFTLPPAVVCTVIAMILVGRRHCKLAWISLLSFALPFVIALFYGLWMGISHLFK